MSCLFLDQLLLLPYAPGVVNYIATSCYIYDIFIITAVWAAFQYHVCIYYYLTVVAQMKCSLGRYMPMLLLQMGIPVL